MTKRLSVAVPYMNWRDGQQVDQADLVFEQSHNLQTQSAIVNNFFGSGLIPYSMITSTLFDSDDLSLIQSSYVSSNDFDGRGILPTNQPTDNLLGSQIKITLSDSNVTIKKCVKVCIIGLNFEGTVQYEFFYFFKNESQITRKHYKNIITLLFNDFKGNKNCSLNLSGRILIQEALPMELSRDPIMASNNIEPNLFFRDFKVVDETVGINSSTILETTLKTALDESSLGSYSVDSLNINIGYLNLLELGDDITTRYGQKFKAVGNNIQKVRLLLGTQYSSVNNFDWTGTLIVSIHSLQTSVACPTDTIPDNAINYSPNPSSIAQIAITQTDLLNAGIVLTDIVQPIDFIFSNSRIGGSINTGIVDNNYYVVTIQRAGDSSVGNIYSQTGTNVDTTLSFTQFNGITWTNDPTQSLWFEVYSDSLKIADGIGYDAGNSVSIPKIATDIQTGATIDYLENGISLSNNGKDVLNYAVVQSVNNLITEVQDDRTGSPVYSQQVTKAEISTLTTTQLTSLSSTEEPIILGYAYDINNKSSVIVNGTQNYIGLTGTNTYDIIAPSAQLKLYNLAGAHFYPNISLLSDYGYTIYKANLCIDGYGDLDGSGIVEGTDVLRASALLNEDITSSSTQTKIANGTISILEFLRADLNGNGIIDADDINNINKLYNKDPSVVLLYGATFERLTLYVENFIGRNDYYHQCTSGYARLYTPEPTATSYTTLTANELLYYGYPVPVNITSSNASFTTVPFVSLNYRISITPKWMEQFLKTAYTGRLLPCTFTNMDLPTIKDCTDPVAFSCNTLEKNYDAVGGQNDLFVPGNLIMGNGEILNSSGDHHPIDLESCIINLTLPDGYVDNKSIDLFNSFVAEEVGTGFTSKGFPAFRFSDCTYVQKDALVKNQVKFNVSISSINQDSQILTTNITKTIVVPNTWESAINIIPDMGNTTTIYKIYTTIHDSGDSNSYFSESIFGVSKYGAIYKFTGQSELITTMPGGTYFDSDSPGYDVQFNLNSSTGEITVQFKSPIAGALCTSIVNTFPPLLGSDSPVINGFAIQPNALIGTSLNPDTGVITITSSNVKSNVLDSTESCILSIQVLLKKSGWRNQTTNVLANQVSTLLS